MGLKYLATNVASLGKFGEPHIDAPDALGGVTDMLNCSPPYDGIEPDVFYVTDVGIGWEMQSLDSFFFSGLHWHGGCQPVYRPDREDPTYIYNRLTLIAYPPEVMLSGEDSVAFASLSNGGLLPVGFEWRDPAT